MSKSTLLLLVTSSLLSITHPVVPNIIDNELRLEENVADDA